MGLSTIFLALAPVVIAVGVLRYRSDYRRFGRTTALGLVLLVAAWAMPHLVLGFSMPFFPLPTTLVQWTGYGLAVLGVALLLVPFCRFTTKMNLGVDTSRLITSGIYRISRNPQYAGYVLFPVGYALVGQRLMAFAGAALYVVVMHLTVLVEEEHLERCFGDEYHRYKKKTPRYFLF